MENRQKNLDIDFLKELLDTDVVLPEGWDPFDFALQLMPNLRSTNAELRDDITYSLFVKILQRKWLSPEQTASLLRLSLSDEYLFHEIGENHTDSVFARTFAVLIVAAIVEFDCDAPILSVEDVQYATEQVVRYAFEEQDYRGFVDGKGWAHSVAHTADALDSCAQHPHASIEGQKHIMEAIHHLANVAHSLSHGEDDRLAFAAFRLIRKDREGHLDWDAWIERFDVRPGGNERDTIRHSNVGHFLRALYFLLLWEASGHPLTEKIQAQIKHIHAHYHYGALPIAHS